MYCTALHVNGGCGGIASFGGFGGIPKVFGGESFR